MTMRYIIAGHQQAVHLLGIALMALAALVGEGLQRPVLGQSLPAGFVDTVVVGGLNLPTAFTTLPDGRLLIAEKNGLVRLFKNGVLLSTPFIDLRSSVNDYWDRGLLGIAADLDFSTNGYVYLLYTYENNAADYSGHKSGRLTRVSASGDIAAPGSAVTILGTTVGSGCNNFPAGTDCIPSESPSHSVGGIRVSSDATLFVSLGDGAEFNIVDDDALRAQNLDSLSGKLLHITRTGAGVSTNPFWTGNASENRSKVFAYGLRNAFRMGLHPNSDLPYLGDVGWGEWEEINAPNAASPSVNLGWPCYEGLLHQSGYEPKAVCQSLYALGPSAVQMPVISYYHNSGGSSAVVGGTFYTGALFPSQYDDAFFYADYAVGFIRYFKVDPVGVKSGPLLGFGANLQAAGPVYLDSDGAGLLYVAINTGEIRRISYETNDSSITYLSDGSWTSMTNGLGPVERDQSNGDGATYDGRVITLAGLGYAKGLGVHAPSDVRFALNGACTTFQAAIGVDGEVGSNGSVVFQVWADGIKVYESGTMDGSSATQAVNLNVSGTAQLQLVVTDGGNGNAQDHADWADARLTCGPTTPPSVIATTPPAGSTGVPPTANVTATFSEAMNAATLTTSTVTLVPQGSSTPAGATVTYDAATRTVTLDPSATLAAGTTYTATIKGGSGGATDVAGSPLPADVVWTFTTATSGASAYLSDLAWTAAVNGWGPVERDRANGDLAPGDGLPITLNGVTYVKGLGTHAASDIRYALNGVCTVVTAVVGVDDEVGSNGSVVFQVFTDGVIRYDSGIMTGATALRNVFVDTTGATELALVVAGWSDGIDFDHADWANAQITCGSDTSPPTVVSTNPPATATGVSTAADVTATFSEAMNASTLTTSTVTLVPQGSTTPVAATVTYDSATDTVTLDPTASLAGNTTYTATITGGSGGAKDLSGNALTSDMVWSFTTGSAPNTLPTATITAPQSTLTFKVGDVINYAGSGTDPEDGTLPGASLSWQIVLHHCPGTACHNHPFTSSTGTSGSFTVPDHGDGMYFQIDLTATDSAGLSTTASVNIYPQTIQLTLDTTPSGLTVVYGGTSYTAPTTFTTLVGSTHTISAPSPQGLLSFIEWSDGGASLHNVIAGSTNVTYVATFRDITPPTVTDINPNDGATRVNAVIKPSATFSEPMNAATITSATVRLLQEGITPVAAAVSYDAGTRKVTIRPTSRLLGATAYSVQILGGSGGVKDPAGNAMTADMVWTFMTR